MLIIFGLLAVWRFLERWLSTNRGGALYYGHRSAPPSAHRCARKPPWVRDEVLRLKALMPDEGCRHIADCFNRRFEERRGISVGKTFINDAIRENQLVLLRMRQHLKHRIPRPMPINRVWAIDLTGKGDAQGFRHTLMGVVDHGSRACLLLKRIKDRSSWGLLVEIAGLIQRYGCPKAIRTDNEAVFTSLMFKFGLKMLGIRHQRIQLACPWQNGRIERFFGTLKQKLDRWSVVNGSQLDASLGLFRFWYNQVRPHHHLSGQTPAQVWQGKSSTDGNEHWFQAWDGLLVGFYLPSG